MENKESRSIMPSAITARLLMKEIQYDNGAVNIYRSEEYPVEWVNKIRIAVLKFNIRNPTFKFTEEVINDICTGGEDEVIDKYGHLEEYDNLSKVLNEYFNNM